MTEGFTSDKQDHPARRPAAATTASVRRLMPKPRGERLFKDCSLQRYQVSLAGHSAPAMRPLAGHSADTFSMVLNDARSAAGDYLKACDNVRDFTEKRPRLLMSQAGLFETNVERSGLERPATSAGILSSPHASFRSELAPAPSPMRLHTASPSVSRLEPKVQRPTIKGLRLAKPASEPVLKPAGKVHSMKAVGQTILMGITISKMSRATDEASGRKQVRHRRIPTPPDSAAPY